MGREQVLRFGEHVVGIDWGDQASRSVAVALKKQPDGTVLVVDEAEVRDGTDAIGFDGERIVEYRGGRRLVDVEEVPRETKATARRRP
jgi:hypothetical protein